MRRYITIITALFSFMFCLTSYGQMKNFDEKVDVGYGLYKVKMNNHWGLVDKDDNLKLSIEYDEPFFLDGYAILTKNRSDQLTGVVDSLGNFKPTNPYYFNTTYPFITDGMLPVRESQLGNWGFLNVETGELLNIQLKGFKTGKNNILQSLGINGKGVKGYFVFDFIVPFIEGIAVVHTDKTGWHHIDRNGQERFKNPNLKPTMFRTSVHNGETVIFDDRGIVLCKELPDKSAGVFMTVDDDYELKNYIKSLRFPYVINTNGSKLFLNYKFQADKYENAQTGDSIIFIERPPVIQIVEEPTDSFTLARDIKVSLNKNSVSAGAKGTAAVTLNISNIGEFDSTELSVSVDINGTKKSWNGTISVGATQQITLYVPAKFSAASISRNVEWYIESGQDEIAGEDKVTIKRYKPSR